MADIHTSLSLKTIREALCVAEAAIWPSGRDDDEIARHGAVIGALITDIDRQRPLGPDGKHGTEPVSDPLEWEDASPSDYLFVLRNTAGKAAESLAPEVERAQAVLERLNRLADDAEDAAQLVAASDIEPNMSANVPERSGLTRREATDAEFVQARAAGWDEGYRFGVEDERTSEANIGVAGFGMKVNPARVNPYRVAAPDSLRPPAEADKPDVPADAAPVIVYGASDDLIEVRGTVDDELGANYDKPTTVRVDIVNGQHVWLSVEHDPDGTGEWRIVPVSGHGRVLDFGHELVTIVPARGEDECDDGDGCPGHSDKAIVRGGISIEIEEATS